jgi:hypothetical protein
LIEKERVGLRHVDIEMIEITSQAQGNFGFTEFQEMVLRMSRQSSA